MGETDERRKNLTDDAIGIAVKKAMKELNGEADIIAEKAIEKLVHKINKDKSIPIGIEFRDDAEREKFQDAIPSLLEFNEGVKKTRKATKWVGLALATYFIGEFLDFAYSIWEAVSAFIKQ